jgi:hypothetical protein
MTSFLQTNLIEIRERMALACQRAGRQPEDVTLLPVSKTFAPSIIRDAAALGLKRFGENRVQEIRDKSPELADLDLQWVLIGHLQTNKAKDAARLVGEVQSLDRDSLAQELDRRLQALGRGIDVLVQVKTSTEPSKFGLAPEDLPTFLNSLRGYASLRPCGLMTLAENTEDEARVRACFRLLRALRDQALEAGHDSVTRLSMGMSGDFEWAIEEGSTEVRMGSLLFGRRPAPAGQGSGVVAQQAGDMK